MIEGRIRLVLLALLILLGNTGCLTSSIVENKYRTDCVGNLTPCTTAVYSIGSPTALWAGGYFSAVQANRVNIYNNATYISRDGLGNMIFTDVNSGTQTLASLMGGGGGANITTTPPVTIGAITQFSSPTSITDSPLSHAAGNIDFGAHNITNVGTVDGVDVSALGNGNVTYTQSTADYVTKWNITGNLVNSLITSNTTHITVSGGIAPTGNITMAAGATVDGVDISTLSLGSGNVTSSGGTSKSIPKFTSSTNIANSLISDNGSHAGVGQLGMDLPRMWTVHDGTGDPQLRLSYTAGSIFTDLWSDSSGYFIIDSTGNRVGIEDTTPSYTLDVGGTMGVQGNMTMNSYYINNLHDPSAAQDAATKNYVDTHLGTGNVTTPGLTATYMPVANSATGISNSIVTASATNVTIGGNLGLTGNITLAAGMTVDGVDISSLSVGTGNVTTGDGLATYVPVFSSGTNINRSIMTSNATYVTISGGVTPTGNIVMSAGATVDGVDISGISGSANVTYTQATADYVPKWNVAGNLVNSIITTNATYVNVTGSIAPTGNITMSPGMTVDGVDISTLSASSGNITGSGTNTYITKWSGAGTIVNATNTDAQVSSAVSASHTSGNDTALGIVGTKNPPIDADKALYRDSAAGDALVTSTWTQVKAFLKTYFDGIYSTIGGYLTNPMADDSAMYFGTSNDTALLWETADANANALILALPDGGAVNVPVLVIGDQSVINSDLGVFNGITRPMLEIMNVDADRHLGIGSSIGSKYEFQFETDAANIHFITWNDYSHYLTVSVHNEGIPTLYGTGAYLRIGDAGTTAFGLASEDDLMVSGKLEVTGAAFFPSSFYIGNGYAQWSTGDSMFYLNHIGDANANCIVFNQRADATYVPVLLMGTGLSWDTDFGFFNGYTQPTIAALDIPHTSWIGFTHTANATPAIISNQPNIYISSNITLPAGATVDGVDISTLGASSGNVTYTQATADVLPKWSAAGNLVNSTISSNATSVYISNNLQVSGNLTSNLVVSPGITIDGVDISALGTGNVTNPMLNDVDFAFGSNTTNNAKFLFETADADAHKMIIALPDVSANATPILAIGDQSIINKDLGIYTGVADPSVLIMDKQETGWVMLQSYCLQSSYSPFNFITGDWNHYLALGSADSIPTLYGTGAYLRIGDAATTSHGLASEDDLLITGILEVDGRARFDSPLDCASVVNLQNNVPLGIGSSSINPWDAACLFYDVTDPNALLVKLTFTKETANDVPVLMVGDDSIRNHDVGLFDGYTQPTVVVMDIPHTSWIGFTHTANATPAIMSNQNNIYISSNITLPAGATVDGVDISTLGASSGNVTYTQATADVLPKWSAAGNLVNSTISSNATSVYITNNLQVTGNLTSNLVVSPGITIDGVDISALVIPSGSLTNPMLNDTPLYFGTSNQTAFLFETADANANAMLIALPNGGGGTNVSVLVVGDQTAINKDIGRFDGIAEPTIAVMNDDATDYLKFTGAGDIITNGNANPDITLRPNIDAQYFRFNRTDSVPTIYGVGAYLRVGDASTTSNALASEDDLMVSGKLEVDGVAYLDTHVYMTQGYPLSFSGNDEKFVIRNNNADANAIFMHFGGTDDAWGNIPLFLFTDANFLWNSDLGTKIDFSALAFPLIAAVDTDWDSYIGIGHTANNTPAIMTNQPNIYISSNITLPAGATVDGVDISTLSSSNTTISLTYVIDGGGSAITTGIKGDLEIPFACTIDRATALADTTGNITVSIWKDTYANYPPTSTDNITAAAPVTILASNKSQDSTLTGWTKAVNAGDTLRFNVDACAVITRLTISLRAVKN